MTKKKQKVSFRKNFFENAAWEGKSVVCGIDEVGRGCLAGPLVTAAVILPTEIIYRRLKDSKIMSPEERNLAAKWIKKHCWYGIGIIHNRLIDEHNIWGATLLAMKKALLHVLATCPQLPSAILIDAVRLDIFDTGYQDIPVHAFPKGEKKSTSIAAASILAKVTRDEIMRQFDPVFPNYTFASHKGYGTKLHKTAIKELQHSIIHRMSFLGKTMSFLGKTLYPDNYLEEQLTIGDNVKQEYDLGLTITRTED